MARRVIIACIYYVHLRAAGGGGPWRPDPDPTPTRPRQPGKKRGDPKVASVGARKITRLAASDGGLQSRNQFFFARPKC